MLALLGSVSALAEDEPQLIFPNPVQPTLNGARVALVKGIFYLGIPIIVPLPPAILCDLVLKSGARFEEWTVGKAIGRGDMRDYAGSIATSGGLLRPLGGRIIPVSATEAFWDINDDGIQQSDEPIFELIDEFTVRLTNLSVVSARLIFGCLDFVFWHGFVILNPNKVDFCIWSIHGESTQLEPAGSNGLYEGHILRTVGGGKLLPGLFSLNLGSILVLSQITMTNTGYQQLQGFLEFIDAVTGSFTFPFSMSFNLAPGASRILRLPFFEALRVMAFIQSSSSLSELRTAVTFATYNASDAVQTAGGPAGPVPGELLGAAGLASPPLAGNHVLSVSRTAAGANTGVLIANPNDHIGNLQLTLLDVNDEQVAEAPLVMQPTTSTSQFFLQYFELAPAGEFADFEGTLRISGDVPTAVITLGTQDGFQQFSLPAGGGQIGN